MITDLDFDNLKKEFYNYLKQIKISSKIRKWIELKTSHTENVIRVGEELAIKLNLDLQLAKTICLLHDIGRFPQLEKYQTLNDLDSVDHAELGIEIIQKLKLLDNFDEKELILTSIKYHNKIMYDVPIFDEPLNTYIKFIRDVDKIDIYRVVLEFKLLEEIKLPFLQDSYDGFMKGQQLNISLVKNPIDYLILELSWIYDINFNQSFEILKKQGYLLKLANLLPIDSQLNKIIEKVYEKLDGV